MSALGKTVDRVECWREAFTKRQQTGRFCQGEVKKKGRGGRTSVILKALQPPLSTSPLVLASRRAAKRWWRWKHAWTLLIFGLLDGERVLDNFDLVGLGQSEGRREVLEVGRQPEVGRRGLVDKGRQKET